MSVMSDSRPEDYGQTPTVAVRLYRHGRLWVQELCESADEAALSVEEWSELEGVTCEVDDLSVRHRAGDILPRNRRSQTQTGTSGVVNRRGPPGVRHGNGMAASRELSAWLSSASIRTSNSAASCCVVAARW
jgi:hypothetical protein